MKQKRTSSPEMSAGGVGEDAEAHEGAGARVAKDADARARVDANADANAKARPKSIEGAKSTEGKADAAGSRRAAAVNRCTYLDCIMGRARVPGKDDPLKNIFTLLMVGGMVTFMVTYNGLSASNWDLVAFFSTRLWMYPVIFCVALAVRIFIADKIIGVIMSKIIVPRFRGLSLNIAATVANLLVMGTVMCVIITLLLKGAEGGAIGFSTSIATSLPQSYLVAGIVNYFIVAPIVKMLIHNVIPPGIGVRITEWRDRYLMPILPFFGS